MKRNNQRNYQITRKQITKIDYHLPQKLYIIKPVSCPKFTRDGRK